MKVGTVKRIFVFETIALIIVYCSGSSQKKELKEFQERRKEAIQQVLKDVKADSMLEMLTRERDRRIKSLEQIKTYFNENNLDLIEGMWVWEDATYEIAIIKNVSAELANYDYVAYNLNKNRGDDKKFGDVLFLIKKTSSERVFSVFYNPSYKGNKISTSLVLVGDTIIEMTSKTIVANPLFVRHLREGISDVLAYNSTQIDRLFRGYPQKKYISKDDEKSASVIMHGTGFFIAKDILVTNYHVVADAKAITLLHGEDVVSAEIIIKDQYNDLAVLRAKIDSTQSNQADIMKNMVPLPIADIRLVKDGDKVFTIGFPLTQELGKRARVSEGIINSLFGLNDDPRMLQVSIPIQPGNSGSPLFNEFGDIIGVVTSTVNNAYLIIEKGTFPQNVNFAIKVNYLNNLINILPSNIQTASSNRPKKIDATKLFKDFSNSIILIESHK